MKSRRDHVRDALERAPGDARPDVTRLVDAVPGLMAEARRRAAAPPDLSSILAARSWWAVPRLAVATAVLVVIASIALFVGSDTTTAAMTFDGVILDDGAESSGDTGDVLLDAVLDAGGIDG